METHYLVLDDSQQQQFHEMSSDYPYVCLKTDMTNYHVPWHWQQSRSDRSSSAESTRKDLNANE